MVPASLRAETDDEDKVLDVYYTKDFFDTHPPQLIIAGKRFHYSRPLLVKHAKNVLELNDCRQ